MCIRTSQALCARTCQEHPGNSFNSFRDPIRNWPRFVCFFFLSPESAIPTSERLNHSNSLANLSRATNLMIDSLCTDYELFPLDLSLCLKKPSKNSATLLCLRGLFLEECPRVFVRFYWHFPKKEWQLQKLPPKHSTNIELLKPIQRSHDSARASNKVPTLLLENLHNCGVSPLPKNMPKAFSNPS